MWLQSPQQRTNCAAFFPSFQLSPHVEELLSEGPLPLCDLLLLQFDLVEGGEHGDDSVLELFQHLLHPAVIALMLKPARLLGEG